MSKCSSVNKEVLLSLTPAEREREERERERERERECVSLLVPYQGRVNKQTKVPH